MQQKNYTNPLDRGRYGFSASGKFNTPYKLETLMISVAIAAGIVGVILVTIFAVVYVRSRPTGIPTGVLFEALLGTAVMFGAVVIAVVAGLSVKVIAQGYTCRFIADEEKFIVDFGSSQKTIYYADVQAVHFMPRSFFRKVHGYNVTVKVNNLDEEFAITSDGYLSESATPFYIIKERVEILRRDEEARRTSVQAPPLGSQPLKPVGKDEVPLTDRVASMLGKDAEMPGVSAVPKSEGSRWNCPENDTILPEISTKVSPTVNGYADDMPSVDAHGRIIGTAPSYMDSDGRERSVSDIIAAGSFREVMRPQIALLVAVVATVVYVIIYFMLYFIFTNAHMDVVSLIGLDPTMPLQIVLVAVILLAPFYAGTIINFMKNGELYSYKANGREFVVTSKSKKEDRILYADVREVLYKKMEFLWFIKGYRVTILTTHGEYKYNYVCEGMRLPDTSVLPFEVIRERISK